jgi:hypothetical protein
MTEDEREILKQVRLEVHAYLISYPVGSQIDILGNMCVITEIYSNYPVAGVRVKVVYFNKIDGLYHSGDFPIEALVNALSALSRSR